MSANFFYMVYGFVHFCDKKMAYIFNQKKNREVRKNLEKDKKREIFFYSCRTLVAYYLFTKVGGGGGWYSKKKNGPPRTPTPPPWLEIQRELGEQAPGITQA